jgi:hypothetical protein
MTTDDRHSVGPQVSGSPFEVLHAADGPGSGVVGPLADGLA